ncbi:hypothetical protein D3C75_1070670 [compost metagenome]
MQGVHEGIALISAGADHGGENQVGCPGILPGHQCQRNKTCCLELLVIAHKLIPGLRRLDPGLLKHFLIVEITDVLLLVADGPDLPVPGIGGQRRFADCCLPFRILA